MLASVIHPSDVGLINGSYGYLKDLPAVGGREGVGKVVAVGPKTEQKLLGKICSLPEEAGTWQEYATAKTDELILLPALVPPEQEGQGARDDLRVPPGHASRLART